MWNITQHKRNNMDQEIDGESIWTCGIWGENTTVFSWGHISLCQSRKTFLKGMWLAPHQGWWARGTTEERYVAETAWDGGIRSSGQCVEEDDRCPGSLAGKTSDKTLSSSSGCRLQCPANAGLGGSSNNASHWILPPTAETQIEFPSPGFGPWPVWVSMWGVNPRMEAHSVHLPAS